LGRDHSESNNKHNDRDTHSLSRGWVDVSISNSNHGYYNEVKRVVEQEFRKTFYHNVSIFSPRWASFYSFQILRVLDFSKDTSASDDIDNQINENDVGLSIDISVTQLIFMVLQQDYVQIHKANVS
jgi:hypothetical protein